MLPYKGAVQLTHPNLNNSGLSAGITWISCLIGMTPTNSGSASTYTVSSGTFLDINISAVQMCPNKPVCNTSC